jgi:hypothetical protein
MANHWHSFQQSLVWKAQALNVAVNRGRMPVLPARNRMGVLRRGNYHVAVTMMALRFPFLALR